MSSGHQNSKGSQNNKIIDRNTVVFRTGNRDPDEYNGKILSQQFIWLTLGNVFMVITFKSKLCRIKKNQFFPH